MAGVGAAIYSHLARLSADLIGSRETIERVLGDASYRKAAERFKRLIAEGNGLSRAASIIEAVITETSSGILGSAARKL